MSAPCREGGGAGRGAISNRAEAQRVEASAEAEAGKLRAEAARVRFEVNVVVQKGVALG